MRQLTMSIYIKQLKNRYLRGNKKVKTLYRTKLVVAANLMIIRVFPGKERMRMIQGGELAEILSGYFKWDKARLHCFAGMLLALIRVRTVNLRELACGFDSNVQMESRYRRIRRFLSGFLPKQETVARWVMAMFGLEGTPVTLSIDRTNWKWGKKNINILMLSAVCRGTALPLFWMLLAKRGNSTTAERIKIIKRFIRCFGRDTIDCPRMI